MKKHLFLAGALLSTAVVAQAQQGRRISGVVRSAKGEELPGVTVVVKGTSTGATTDPEGKFTLNVTTDNPVLRFSFIGFEPQDVTVGSNTDLTVTLKEDAKTLDDVVVIGYQQVQRRDVTGSVASVNAQQIKDIPVNSAADALAGRLAGVQVTSSEGQPGADVRIRVRGGGSITQDNSPLYVVDGVQVENALQVLSPQDIQSVDVLKDASATAIYGARGANGVVIITTKGGREGKTTVSYNGFAGFRRITKKLDVLKPDEYIDYSYERAAIAGSAGLTSFKKRFGSNIFTSDTLNNVRNSPFIDWQDKVFGRDAFQQTHNVAVSGGGKGTTYSLSLTSNGEEGIQYSSKYSRKLVNFRFDHKASDKFRFGFNTRFNDQDVKGGGTGTVQTGNGSTNSGSTSNTRLRSAVVYQPVNSAGSTAINPEDLLIDDDLLRSDLVNPILAIDNEYRRDLRRLFNVSGYASLTLFKSLTLRSTIGFDNTNSRREIFFGQYSPAVLGKADFQSLPAVSIASSQLNTLNNSNVLTYSKTVGKHSIDALLGHEIYQQVNRTQYVQTKYLPIGITAEKAIDNINQGVPPSSNDIQTPPITGRPQDATLLSGFARLNYSYDDKYLLTGTFRADGSSKFAPENRWGFFPAGSFAWRVSKENFMSGASSTISDLKLRLSYGLAGNNRIGDFQWFPNFYAGNSQYALGHQIVYGTAATTLANKDLKWETTVSRNVGIDVSLFNNRVQFSVDAYNNKTRDLLINIAIPSTSGYESQLVNVGATTNRGMEFQGAYTAIQNGNFTWTLSPNIAFNRGRVESLGEISALTPQSSGWAGTSATIPSDYLVQSGQPVGLMYGFVTDYDNGRQGFYTTDDFEGYSNGRWVLKSNVASDATIIGGTVAPGSLKLKDLNGDGVVNVEDRQVIGNANPKFTGGLNQQFTYKNFDASIFLNFVYGNDIYNANKIEFSTYSANNYFSNGLGILRDRYRTIDENGAIITDPNKLNEINQNAKIWSPARQFVFHSWAVEDGSFLRINNLTVGYSLPKSVIQRAKLTQARFYVTLNNLYTFTKYSGYDPEVNTRTATPLTPGVDYAAYPRSRAFLFGVNLSL